jgi:hypothetical protein
MGRLRLGIVLAGLVVAAVTFIPSVASAAAVTDGVTGLQLCSAATHNQCDLLLAHEHFIDYANVCSYDDCFFVSAADWEKVAAGVTPTLTTLDVDYKAAGQTFGGGVSAPDLWTYWKTSGIDGVYLESETAINKSEASVENAVKAKRALIVDDDSRASMIGSEKADIGIAIMLVDGYTPKGPLVVFQAKTLQMTWAQWNAQVRNVWEVAVSKTPPQGTTTTTPPPPTTTTSSPTATLSLSPNSLTSAGGNVTLTYSSENATSCTLTSSPAIWTTATETVPCSGTYVDTVAPSTTAQKWSFTLTASNSVGLSATSAQTLVESASTAPTPQFDNSSTNWSGYVVPSSSALVTDISGDWTVPILDCSDTPTGDSSAWVGIGGQQWNSTSSSGVLLQTGTESDCVNGVQENDGWWEEYPANPNHEEIFNEFPVSPGNEIEAAVYELNDGSWETAVSDLTTGLSGYMITGEAWGVSETGAPSFTDQGSTTGLSYSGSYTAEWIVEDTGVASTPGSYYPFANFGSITFSDMRSSFSSWYLTPDEGWGIVQSGVTLAAPTSTSTDGFTDTYTGP